MPQKEAEVTLPMVEKLLHLSNLGKTMTDYLRTAARLEMAAIKDFTEEDRQQIIDAAIERTPVAPYLLPVYTLHFSADELLDVIAFFRSKSGQKYIEVSSKVSDNVLAVMPKITLEMTISLASEIAKRRNPS
jgi:hypothetical protein